MCIQHLENCQTGTAVHSALCTLLSRAKYNTVTPISSAKYNLCNQSNPKPVEEGKPTTSTTSTPSRQSTRSALRMYICRMPTLNGGTVRQDETTTFHVYNPSGKSCTYPAARVRTYGFSTPLYPRLDFAHETLPASQTPSSGGGGAP
jgi:hypothetical protein